MPQEPVTAIINVFNEAQTIEAEIRSINEEVVSRIPGSEFIVAEDGSTDGTREIVAGLVEELGIVHLTGKERKGYARALCDALLLAGNPWVFFLDVGGKNDPKDFWKLYREREGADLVIGLRSGRRDQLYRRLLTCCYNSALRAYFRLSIRDADSGFRLYRTALVKEIAGQDWMNSELVSSEIAVRCAYMGGRIREVPVGYRQRKGSSRGLPLGKIPRAILGVIGNFPRLKLACRKMATAAQRRRMEGTTGC